MGGVLRASVCPMGCEARKLKDHSDGLVCASSETVVEKGAVCPVFGTPLWTQASLGAWRLAVALRQDLARVLPMCSSTFLETEFSHLRSGEAIDGIIKAVFSFLLRYKIATS